jgi:alpha-L-arabinofuranosidase
MLWGYALGIVAVGREETVAGPSARMMELYGTYERCEAVRVITEGSPIFDVPAKGTWLGAKGAPYLDVSARVLPDGRTLDLFIVNRSLSEDLDAAVKVNGGNIGSIESATLNGADAREWNSFQEPERVTIRTTHVPAPHGHFPAHSITKWTIKLQ